MIIDAHQHFWNFDRLTYTWPTENESEIYRNIEPPELEPLLKKTGIQKTVVVQAKDSCSETDYLLELAKEHCWIAGVVGWVPLQEPEKTEETIQHYKNESHFKGVRHLIHEEENPDWIVQEKVIESLKILAANEIPYDFVAIFPKHLHHVLTIVEKVPDLKLVIDHLAKPPIKEKEFTAWAKLMSEVSQHENVYSKISGLNTAADPIQWDYKDIKPYIDYAIDIFGSGRLMYGSDWPVANLAGDYIKVWNETKKALEDKTDEEKRNIYGLTAKQFYKLT